MSLAYQALSRCPGWSELIMVDKNEMVQTVGELLRVCVANELDGLAAEVRAKTDWRYGSGYLLGANSVCSALEKRAAELRNK